MENTEHMKTNPAESAALPPKIFKRYFEQNQEYRNKVWQVLCHDFFQQFVGQNDAVLDLGCGYGHFINNIASKARHAMDLNPEGGSCLHPDVKFIAHDCTKHWPFEDAQLDAVFTSNFFEHLSDKNALKLTLEEAFRCLKPGGRLIALGPNIKYLPGEYWDFSDHSLPLTELSLAEVLEAIGFGIERCVPKFLPYTMVNKRETPLFMVRAYLRTPLLWSWYGRQFLVVARK